jgi:hypothetical protein
MAFSIRAPTISDNGGLAIRPYFTLHNFLSDKKSLTPSFVAAHKFSKVGSYDIVVTVFNVLGSHTVKHKTYCQHPIEKTKYELKSNAPVKVETRK